MTGGAMSTACPRKSVLNAISNWRPTTKRRAIGARSTTGPIRSASFAIPRRRPSSPRNTKPNSARRRPNRLRARPQARLTPNPEPVREIILAGGQARFHDPWTRLPATRFGRKQPSVPRSLLRLPRDRGRVGFGAHHAAEGEVGAHRQRLDLFFAQ